MPNSYTIKLNEGDSISKQIEKWYKQGPKHSLRKVPFTTEIAICYKKYQQKLRKFTKKHTLTSARTTRIVGTKVLSHYNPVTRKASLINSSLGFCVLRCALEEPKG